MNEKSRKERSMQMRLGADSWLLFKVAEKDDAAILLLKEVEYGKHRLIVSVLSFGEIKVGMYRLGKPQLAEEAIMNFVAIPNVEVVNVDLEVVDEAARRKSSLGLSFVDSLILASALIKGCEIFVTGDSDFEIVEKQNIVTVRRPESIVG